MSMKKSTKAKIKSVSAESNAVEKVEKVDLKSELNSFLQSAKDWEKLETSIEGLFIVKVPAKKNKAGQITAPPSLSIEVNPSNKFKGLYINNLESLGAIAEILINPATSNVLGVIEGINPSKPTKEVKSVKKLTIQF